MFVSDTKPRPNIYIVLGLYLHFCVAITCE